MIKPSKESPPATPPGGKEDPPGGGPPKDPKGTDLMDAIGRELKFLLDGVATEPVPERFRQLLDELERKSGER